MPSLRLPNKLDGEAYEDYVISILMACGNFVEPRIALREGKIEICELDLIATSIFDSDDNRGLYELKNSNTGSSFSNVFKLSGQMKFLGYNEGFLVFSGDGKDTLKLKDLFLNKLNIRILQFDPRKPKFNLFKIYNRITTLEIKHISNALRFSNFARRIAIKDFNAKVKGEKKPIFNELKEYAKSINDSFFEPEIRVKAITVYNAYKEADKITKKLIKEVANGEKDEGSIWSNVYKSKKYLYIQRAMDLEHYSRFLLVKHALDMSYESDVLDFDSVIYGTPSIIQNAIDVLRDCEYRISIPYLFQVFYSAFGGILYMDKEEELDLLSRLTNIPPDKIIESLLLYKKIFNFDFFYEIEEYKILCLKNVPAFVSGIGMLTRKYVFNIESLNDSDYKYSSKFYLPRYESGYNILEPHLKIKNNC